MTITNKQQQTGSGLVANPVHTGFFSDAQLKITVSSSNNAIMAIDGMPGTGKTTCVTFAAEQIQRPAVLVTLPGRPAPTELLRLTYEALTGSKPDGRMTAQHLGSELRDQLADWGGLLVVDELQNLQAPSMQQLVWLHETSQHGFGLVVVGYGVLKATEHHPQLRSRIFTSAMFSPLEGDELVRAVRSLHPALAGSTEPAILRHDARTCHGLFRRWAHTCTWLGEQDQPVTKTQFSFVEAMMAPA